jgi:hypothetical protein
VVAINPAAVKKLANLMRRSKRKWGHNGGMVDTRPAFFRRGVTGSSDLNMGDGWAASGVLIID